MSYPKDLDEYTDEHLRSELAQRKTMRDRGVCDYCARTPDTRPCKFPDRHRHPDIAGLPIRNARWNVINHRYDCATCHEPLDEEEGTKHVHC